MPKHAIAAGAALALCAGPAAAELTAQGVWNDWQRVYNAMGSTLSAESEDYADGRLTLTGVTTTGTVGGFETISSYGTITLIEQSDGTLRLDIPARLEIVTETTGLGAPQIQTVVMESEGLDAFIREDGPARVYDIDAARLVYSFSDDSGEMPVTAVVTMTGTESLYTSTTVGDLLNLDQDVSASEMTLAVSGAEGTGDVFDMSYALTGLAMDVTGTIDLSAAPQSTSLSEMGLDFTGAATHSGSTLSLDVESSDTGPFALTGTSAAGRFGFSLGADSIGYEISSTEATVSVQPAAFPVPIQGSLAELSTGFRLPVGVSETPKPFGLALTLRDLVVDDAIWGLFDPTGQLPREPATVALDLEGTAVMSTDIFGDPEAMAGLSGPPGELKSMELAELLVSLAGAELTGAGALEFPNPGPIPQPVGTVTLALNGGLALVDRLVALGFVPPQQAAMAKGMAGMVAETVGEDQLRSVIEFTPSGAITANGMPLR
ncbi:DUF2125 domain-containing protein [Jannaschia seohaensis]|uniref:Uncharacterized protein DUF2125 n=1 Tax=Jannaschia seohaensis TaxID=475081 RepID=A0A2Y9BW60_9RHOB|nr:DUF2125 domain-containing protein [Jannaschia seohaensis]PWJ22254.1 uncharacterized protein DUF2125 [Jannaschia seohaensis]SSA38532.1 hypothetical protein SAMN05421539_101665 [Jannaschia seohaensis]